MTYGLGKALDMKTLLRTLSVLSVVIACNPAGAAGVKNDPQALIEDYVREPLPDGFQVVNTPIEGPVFADANGKTLYFWPMRAMRGGGNAGEQKGKPTCDDHRYTENAGLMSPYPGGYVLPEVETRPSCAQVWPPVLASVDDKPVGKWTVVDRPEGRKQWAYDGYPLYTSVLDQKPGDTLAATKIDDVGARGATRKIAAPKPRAPAQFEVYPVIQGHLLGTPDGYSVYTSDKDGPNKSNCNAACLADWSPVLAPVTAEAEGDWSIIEKSPGIRQWAFKKKPLYTHITEEKPRGYEGSDVPGWHNVFTHLPPPPPKKWTVQSSDAGLVLADERGKTIYTYNCNDDALDQLSCNHPNDPQVYRLTMCGKGDPAKCLVNFPYVLAEKNDQGDGYAWTVMHIDPQTGRRAASDQAGSLRVWAFRDRPVYLCWQDQKPGDIECDSWGEFNGNRNGYKAYWLRDDYEDNAG